LTALNISDNNLGSGSTYIKAPRKGIGVGDIIDGNTVVQEEDGVCDIKIVNLVGLFYAKSFDSDLEGQYS
jgi:hypothetical protein